MPQSTAIPNNAVRPLRGAGNLLRKAGGPVIGTAIGVGTDVIFGAMEGLEPAEAIGRGAMYWAATGLLGVAPTMGLLAGIPLARAAATVLPTSYKRKAENWRSFHQSGYGHVGGGFQDTEHALTMRQAGVRAIHESRMNARSALGTEGKLMHR